MKNLRYIFPNLLTLGNLIFGSIAIIMVFRGEIGFSQYAASWVIFACAVFDVFDGLVARALDARSDFGKEMDSLADMVSFGIAPGMILFIWLLQSLENSVSFTLEGASAKEVLILLPAMIYIAASAIRLARFNAKQSESKGFTGLPIPAAAIIISALWLVAGSGEYKNLIQNQTFIITLALTLSFLMVSNIEMLSLKLTGTGLKENIYPYTLVLIGGVLIILFGIGGIILAMAFYILLSLTLYIIKLFRRTTS